jgi:flagellar biosynthesis protein FlhA
MQAASANKKAEDDGKGFSIAAIAKNPDIILGVGFLGALGAMLLPLPTIVLDFLLALSLASSVIILLVGLYIVKPLEFGVFPTVLLLSTIFRLGLNVATSRNILLHGNDPTEVSGLIQAFGNIVIGENFVVGIVIFAILMIINFMVVTKGAGRIAEVAARFTLDAMPGKQMAIDAELNSGHINAEEARKRRRNVEKEADFYGAMDGASKFVRGEAIAAIIITIVNIVVGFIVGVVQYNQSAAAAGKTFTLLTVGDGIVAAIPSLMISIAAGLIVTRSTSEGNLGNEVFKQFKVHPKAFYVTAGLIFVMGAIPGFPKLSFFALAGGIAFLGTLAAKSVAKDVLDLSSDKETDEKKKGDKEDNNLDNLMKVDILSVEVGHGLVHLIDPSQDGEVVDRIQSIRKQFATELGIIVPQVQLRDNLQLDPGQYQISLKGNPVSTGSLMVDYFMAMDPGNVEVPIHGEQTSDPVYGLPALWVHKRDKDEAVFRGYTVVNCATVVATHITNPKVVEEVIHPDKLTVGDVVKVMQNLLREDVSVRDILSLFECLADHCRLTKNTDILSEQCRKAMGRSIVSKYMSETKEVLVVSFDRIIEDKLLGGLSTTESGSTYLDLDAKTAGEILQKLMVSVQAFEQEGTPPCVMVSARLRSAFQKLASPYMPELGILAYDEVPSGIKVRNLKLVS